MSGNHKRSPEVGMDMRTSGDGFVQSVAMEKYRQLLADQGMRKLFAPSQACPLVFAEQDEDGNETDDARIAELRRLEEMHGYRFGVVYESAYNRVVVDPVKNREGGYFPYERVIPKAGNGVVLLTVCNGKFVLLRQFRHALRTEILSFPRGFAEESCTDQENATRELGEELDVHPEDIVRIERIGHVAPDSGILATCASIWLVEIGRYCASVGHEGIMGAVALDGKEMSSYINDGKIIDGFTLAAYALYKTKGDRAGL